MNIYINNEPFQFEVTNTLFIVLEQRGLALRTGVAVAVNNIVVPKSNWDNTLLNDGDKILIISATKGG